MSSCMFEVPPYRPGVAVGAEIPMLTLLVAAIAAGVPPADPDPSTRHLPFQQEGKE